MVKDTVRIVPLGYLEKLQASQRRLRWGFGLLAGLAVALGVSADGRPSGAVLPGGVSATCELRGHLSAVDEPHYDEFLRQYAPLSDDGELRRAVTTQVLAVAAQHRLDPDLLFALIAVESGFNTQAVSPKKARGLGQMRFATAREVAPEVVRRPEDLHEMPRNLYATALHLRQLLDETKGDLRGALRAYYAGRWDRNPERLDRDQYVARVSTRYAYLKTKRTYGRLNPVPAG